MPVRQLSYPGPPVRGTYSLGDVLVDPQGITYICTTAGTPGRWAMQSLSGQAQPVLLRGSGSCERAGLVMYHSLTS